MKIAICSLAIGGEFRKAVAPSQKTKRIYCQTHDYDYIDDETVYDKSRPIAWSKVLLIQKYLPNYDYIVWIDADAMIMDFTQKMEDKIALMGDKDIMCIEHYKDINTGVLFVKNTAYSREFLARLYDQKEFIDSSNWEQDAFVHMWKTESDARDHIVILHFSFERQIQDYWFSFQPTSSFILHYAGYRGKHEQLAYDIRKSYPLRHDDETESDYRTRRDWHFRSYRKWVDVCMAEYKAETIGDKN